jgi:four helix bundle protein
MAFGHEKLHVYHAAIEYVGWAYRYADALKGHQNAKSQLIRASQAIPLNIAEGNGRATRPDRRRFFEIARGSALECAAVQDVLQACGAMAQGENVQAKEILDRIVAMLTKLGGRGYCAERSSPEHPCESRAKSDGDCDCDTDTDALPHPHHAHSLIRTLTIAITLLAAMAVLSHAAERVSVYGLKAIGTSQDLAQSLQEHLESHLIRQGQHEVLSRADISLILGENTLQQSGACSDEACLMETGAVLGVQKIVTGTLSKVGATYNLVLKLLDIASGRLESSTSGRHAGTPEQLLDISVALLDQLIEPISPPAPDTVVRTIVHTRTDTLTFTVRDTVVRADTVRVRDTLYAALPAAPLRKEVIDSREQAVRRAEESADQRRRNRRIGYGAIAVLGSIAAGILTYQLALK